MQASLPEVPEVSEKMHAEVGRPVALARLLIGLGQGILLYALYRAVQANVWPATQPWLLAPLLMLGLFVPAVLITGLGNLNRRQLAIWTASVALILAGLAWHDTWRGGPEGWISLPLGGRRSPLPSSLLLFFGGFGLYIAHALVLAGAADRRRIARYASYFDSAWKLGIQLLFSSFFVNALWLVLWLGAELFMLVKLTFLSTWLTSAWFVIPVIAFAFSCAMHITDVRPAIVRGIRGLLLALASWILPIAVLLVGGFLLALPFTGLRALWATRHATQVLLGANALLIVLINAAFQDGVAGAGLAPPLRWAARVAAVLLLPLSVIGVYALGLRVGDYGWTSNRIIGAACLLVSACYALGYLWAALRPARSAPWLGPVAGVNVVAAFLTLGVLLALFSPLADPARLSTANQMARLAAGRTRLEQFDFHYLRFEGARYGAAALARLRDHPPAVPGWAPEQGPLLARRAGEALALKTRADSIRRSHPDPRNLHVWPAGAQLPDSLLPDLARREQTYQPLPACLRDGDGICDIYLIDLTGDGQPEALVIGVTADDTAALLERQDDGRWTTVRSFYRGLAGCQSLRRQLQAGKFTLQAPHMKDLHVGGRSLAMEERGAMLAEACPAD
jgi:hypothetical protein